MDADAVVDLFDSCWFSLEILTKQASIPNSSKTQTYSSQPKFSSLPSNLMRSKSDDMSALTNPDHGFLSPDSVLFTPKLQTILSGKEVPPMDGWIQELEPRKTGAKAEEVEDEERSEKKARRKRERRRKKGGSKSLTDLEFEELKGFMDLGFVFSEEDKESSLVRIVPGLQRFGKGGKNGEEEDETRSTDEARIARPYLSEAWEGFKDRRTKWENPLMNWRVPALGSGVDMKDSLKLWARNVASAVR